MHRPASDTIRSQARMAGFLYIVVIVLGAFAEIGVRQGLVVPGEQPRRLSRSRRTKACSASASQPR